MFYILAALRAHLRDNHWFTGNGIPEPNLAALLDLVALGTVADVVPLDFNNRILVAQGLARIRAGRCVPGISALLAVAKRQPARTSASDLGFAVGPRLNAAGRLEDMALGIECLLSDDAGQALRMARHLDELKFSAKCRTWPNTRCRLWQWTLIYPSACACIRTTGTRGSSVSWHQRSRINGTGR